jgi:hypothetical protein
MGLYWDFGRSFKSSPWVGVFFRLSYLNINEESETMGFIKSKSHI